MVSIYVKFQNNALEKTKEMVQNLQEFSKKNSFESVEQSLSGIFDTVANTLIVSLDFFLLTLLYSLRLLKWLIRG